MSTNKEIAEAAVQKWYAYQDPFELEMCLDALVRFRGIKVLLEIGVANGASLGAFAAALEPELPIGLDPLTNPKTPEQLASFNELVLDHNLHIIPHTSREEVAHQKLEELLDGKKVDFMFLDGAHGYDDVSHDYRAYLKYMNSPSIIGFHDIFQNDVLSDGGSHVGFFWDRMKRTYAKYDEFYFHSSMGIGLIYLP